MLSRASSVFGIVIAALIAPAGVRAGGFEYAAAGTRPLGRGGAYFARADDPMALFYNPAMLADLPDSQVQLQSHLAFLDFCADRPGTYMSVVPNGTRGPTRFSSEDGLTDPWLADEMPRVCRNGYPGPSPDLAASLRLLPELAIGFGILAPAGVSNARWGSDAGVSSASGPAPSPYRYALAQQDLLLVHPSVGVGWRIHPMVRIGFTFQWGIASVDFVSFSSSGSRGEEDPFEDVRTHLNVLDPFVPAGILSVHVQPHPNLDIVAWGRIHDSVGGALDASGSLEVSTRYFATHPTGDPMSRPETARIEGVRLNAGQPWTFALGVRYADRIRPRSYERGFEAAVRGLVDDPMYSENFDIELDAVYEVNSMVGEYTVTIPTDAMARIDGSVDFPLPDQQVISKRWRDVLALRLGGDWNLIPGTLALRAGFHTEIPLGFSPYQVHDNLSGYRFGLHLGGTVRIERFDISAAYAHIFQLDTTITDGRFRQSATLCNPPDCATPGMGSVVNNATYQLEWNVISLAVGYHFE